ncbi:LOW QUALITY PROTEIN: uncharacterized protein LOC141819877 [Curcuma longa]|uniref:LOW QUALITY PROTEIN: uncharacterized protein LOC141819877 n=1 Tax=Curcuma longa TaxID=136217 RepID=UPI003D9E4C58
MFEGMVSQVLSGYLGRFVKDIQKDQLKIGIWNEEILLEKVELILEAFDYLQLPFALKDGRVGKLSIKIPWKKLGWDPIIIVLENIFICACQREDSEWSSHSVDKRELAGKMAKLDAIELTKLSRRVSDDQAGQSFFSYISAKILDNIQVSIKNVHIVYMDTHIDQESFIFGLKLSSLILSTDTGKQNFTGSSMGRSVTGQVRKVIEISGVALYCNMVEESQSLFGLIVAQTFSYSMRDYEKYDYIINPCDLMISLLVNKSGKLDGTPQYDITVEITNLALAVDEIQVQQIMSLWDYFSICTLRKKYGRYRPPQSLLSMKLQGWQKNLWHYAQNSILADLRQKSRTSSRNLAKRIIHCLKYAKLYKRKLELLQQDQLISKDILHDLEKMDKEYDIDDILSYRSLAEQQLQEALSKLNDSGDAKSSQVKGEQTSSKARSWLNWLSRGLLGAGGTSDTGSFAGVVSDDIIKDIYEATEFHPVPSLSDDVLYRNKSCLSFVKFSIWQIITTIRNKMIDKGAAEMICHEFITECKFWEDSTDVIASVDSIKIVNPDNENAILADKPIAKESYKLPFLSVNFNMPCSDKYDVSTKIVVRPFEVNFESDFFLHILPIYFSITSLRFQHDRVLSSLNGLKNFEARLLRKLEYYFANHKKLYWDVTLDKIILNLPLQNEDLKLLNMVLEFEAFSLKSKAPSHTSQILDGRLCWENIHPSDAKHGSRLNFQIEDIYKNFEIQLAGLKINLLEPKIPRVVSVMEHFCTSVHLGLCIFVDEPNLKNFEVDCIVHTHAMHISVEIVDALLRVQDLWSVLGPQIFAEDDPYVISGSAHNSHSFPCSVSVKFDSWQCNLDLEEDAENSATISLTSRDVDFRYSLWEAMSLSFLANTLKIDYLHLYNGSNCNLLCSKRNEICGTINVDTQHAGLSIQELPSSGSSGTHCLELQYQAQAGGFATQQECSLFLCDIDLHIYPKLSGLLQKFIHKVQSSIARTSVKSSRLSENNIDLEIADNEWCESVFSNFYNFEQSACPKFSSHHFPFVSIVNSGFLNSLKSSSILGLSELKELCIKNEEFSEKMPCITKSSNMRLPSTGIKEVSSANSNCFSMKFSLNRINAYFHDSSCILGILTVPTSISHLRFCETDCWDLQSSIQGVTLSSSWSFLNIHEVLLGPSSASNFPILNICVRKGKMNTMLPATEISIGIQHVCCILSSDFLSLLIGYFSLPDWTFDYEGSEIVLNHLFYKFEVLNSTLLLPLENHEYCVHLELPKLVGSFIPVSNSSGACGEIPSNCMFPESTCSEAVKIVNVFGRSTSLSLLLLGDDKKFLLGPAKCMSNANMPLITQLDADLWIRIPLDTKDDSQNSTIPFLVMVNLSICNLIARDDYFIDGVEAVADAIDQLSSVTDKSEKYTSDALLFLQWCRNSKKEDFVPSQSIISIQCCIKTLSISLYHFGDEDSPLIASVETQLNLSAMMQSAMLQSLVVNIPYLVMRSSSKNILLLSITPEVISSSHLHFSLSKSCDAIFELFVSIPCLEIWLHVSDWNNIVELLQSYSTHLEGTPVSSNDELESECHISPDPLIVSWAIKSENISASLYIPSSGEDELINSEILEVDVLNSLDVPCDNLAESMQLCKLKNCSYLKLTVHSKFCEMTILDKSMEMTFNLDQVRMRLEMVLNSEITSIPFIHVSQVRTGIIIDRKQKELVNICSDVAVQSFDIGISYQVLYFLNCFRLIVPETESSPISKNCVDLKLHLKKGTLLLSDGRWSYHGPILETLTKNMLVQFKQTADIIEGSAAADLLINYNNIDKVMWEAFLEPWSFELNWTRKYMGHVLNSYAVTDVLLNSRKQLNLNITEPLIEAIFRLNHVVTDAFKNDDAYGFQDPHGILGLQTTEEIHSRRYAPYILYNDTSLPLTYHVHCGSADMDDVYNYHMNNENVVQPGVSVPIFVEETLDEHFFQYRPSNSSDRLLDKKMSVISHHMISIYFEGTSGPSEPMSMDLVGLSFFEVNFSKSKHSVLVDIDKDGNNCKTGEQYKSDQHEGLFVPVVFEVSMHHYSKIIRLYSTVILFNATSVPLEVRFDIPLGVSSKILGPVLPGHDIPLPLHLAESGQIRWHPAGTQYLWSEAHSLSNILSHESKLGYLRSFVCYPCHPSNDPFRCCISIQDYSFCSVDAAKEHSPVKIQETEPSLFRSNKSTFLRNHFIRHVRLNTPLLVKNYLPNCLSLTVECAGITRTFSLSEVGTTSIFHIDSAHDLGLTFKMEQFQNIASKFPRADSFSSMCRLNGSVYSSSEKLTFYPENSSGLICATLDKTMDAYCGAREICLSVPFLLYNCTGLFLTILDVNSEGTGNAIVIPPSYNETEEKHLLTQNDGLAFLSSESRLSSGSVLFDSSLESRKCGNNFGKEEYSQSSIHHTSFAEETGVSYSSKTDGKVRRSSSFLSWKDGKGVGFVHDGHNLKIKPCIYGPISHIPATELVVKLAASLSKTRYESNRNLSWSKPFSLVTASGSANITVPQPFASGAFLICAASVPVSGELSGRTRVIVFQPRYIICNACNKNLLYRQKGTNISHHLGVGQHSQLHWSDTSREMLISLRFSEAGSQWSGNFRPDCLGDAQVKVRNYISSVSNMVRVEVQNADMSISKEDMIKNSSGHSMTHLILLSDDDTGFMPYRIDNFSMETLRIYQQKCESCDTTIHPYTSYQYSWDEPCYLHRLIVEVPGERILGAYSLDDIKEHEPVCLPSTTEKPERRLCISVHSEGAVKVLSIIDSNYHVVNNLKGSGSLEFRDKEIFDQKTSNAGYTEMFTIHLPFIGISLMSSTPQELIFACAKETTVVLVQSLDQQKISLKTLSLQIDNQLSDTPYPILLSFDKENRGLATNILRNWENKNSHKESTLNSAVEPVIYFAAARWRNMDKSLVSFEHIDFGLAPLSIELEEQVLLSLFEYFKAVSSRLLNTSLGRNFELGNHSNSADRNLGNAHVYNGKNVLKEKTVFATQERSALLPFVVPVGAPWQHIFLLARRKKKIYVELFQLAPLKLSLSFSSTPWVIRNEVGVNMESLSHFHSNTLQRGLMALVDIEAVPVQFSQLTLAHLMASPESIQEIVTRHYTRQLFHEMYKVLGSAGVIGNPVGFARNVGLGIRDFLSFSGKGVVQRSPSGLITSIAQGSKGLLNNTVYAISSATSQFSKVAHKGIVAFTFDQHGPPPLEEQLNYLDSHGKGVLNEFLEGLTGLLQFPIRGAEKHGLPGVLSGIAMGTAGLIARPVASILEATGKTAQSIRNRSSPHQSCHFRTRLPRPLARELPLSPYSWDEAIGVAVLQADGLRLKDEIFVMCKPLKQAGRFVIISKRLVLVVSSSFLLGLGTPEFLGIPPDPEWVIETEMSLQGVVHIDRTEEVVNVVGSYLETVMVQKRGITKNRPWNPSPSLPVFHTSIELPNEEEAEYLLQVLLSTIEEGKSKSWGMHILHRSNLK